MEGIVMAVRGLEGIDETVALTHQWLRDIGHELGDGPDAAYAALRGVLHALRDWLSTDEVAQLGAQLPMLVRGIYYDGWDPGRKVEHRRDADAFLAHTSARERMDAGAAARAARAVGRVLAAHITPGELDDVLGALAAPVRRLLQ
jgi:uncharacterized protein (DUF2267 family)